jgi:hypothetical protein
MVYMAPKGQVNSVNYLYFDYILGETRWQARVGVPHKRPVHTRALSNDSTLRGSPMRVLGSGHVTIRTISVQRAVKFHHPGK